MLKIATYKQEEMIKIFNTSRMDSIKRSLGSLGFEYEVEGRGKKALFHINKTPSAFKMFAMKELGFPPQTNFDALETFLYWYFCDEEFSKKMVVDMVEEIEYNTGMTISPQTISRWIDKLTNLDLLHVSNQFTYFASTIVYTCGEKERITEEITQEKYSAAWKVYWKAMKEEHSYNAAFVAMGKVVGSGYRVYKVVKLERNAFTNDLYERLIEILLGE